MKFRFYSHGYVIQGNISGVMSVLEFDTLEEAVEALESGQAISDSATGRAFIPHYIEEIKGE